MRKARDSIPAKAGVGLRFRHHHEVLESRPTVAWFEVHTENYMGGGSAPAYLDAIRRDYAVSLHGTGLSLGSAEGLDPAHLARVRKLVERIEPGLVSEHLSWSVVVGDYLADLLPLPMTEEALESVCRHLEQVQVDLKRHLLVENPSTYLQFRQSTITARASRQRSGRFTRKRSRVSVRCRRSSNGIPTCRRSKY